MRPRTFCLIFASALMVAGLAAAPATPRHHHSVIISGGDRRPANDCSDLRIRFDDRDAVVRSETRTLSKAEAPVLKVHPHANGGTQMVGWDQNNYSVTACKAVDAGDGAEGRLSEITMSIENGTVSTHGPSGEAEHWTVYLLIRTPKSATVEVETLIGPFSVEGSSGSLRIRTENGPINVDLQGTSWNGSGLSADAENGPVTLRVPSGFQSGFVVESTNHAPMSCRASICSSARKTWDDEHRRIEYGSSPAVVHLSTVNGPVSVEEARD